jgi:virginiamycin B lyase
MPAQIVEPACIEIPHRAPVLSTLMPWLRMLKLPRACAALTRSRPQCSEWRPATETRHVETGAGNMGANHGFPGYRTFDSPSAAQRPRSRHGLLASCLVVSALLAMGTVYIASLVEAQQTISPGTQKLSAPIQEPEFRRRGSAEIQEFSIPYPPAQDSASYTCPQVSAAVAATMGSTHEITFDANGGQVLWVTGQNYATLVKVGLDGNLTLYSLPPGSGPHGISFDAESRLWITLEFAGEIARLDDNGNIVAQYDVSLNCTTCPNEINTHPHGLGIGPDGMTVWYTGKATGTVGKVSPDGTVQTYALQNVGSVPIYIKAGPDGNMWVTELVGNAIARVTPSGQVTEYPIPTYNSRPIAIVPDPNGNAMWFTEEAGNNLGRIDMNGNITEYPVPKPRRNLILAGLTFDSDDNIWFQQYVDPNNPRPTGPDYVVRADKSILQTAPSRVGKVRFTYFAVPTRQTVMHRIIQGPDGAIWFTELAANKVGKLTPP